MRRYLFAFVFVLAAITAGAYENFADSESGVGADEFVCELKSGATVTWQLTEEPQVELKGGQFIITSSRATVYYTVEDVNRFALHKSATGIETVPQKDSGLNSGATIMAGAGQLILSGCKAGETITIYAINGRQVLQCCTEKNGTLTISTEALPTGVYIVKSRSVNLKFWKK